MSSANRADIRILVVDDEPAVLDGTARLLEKTGYAVNRTTDGVEGLKIVREHRPDIVLLDRDLAGLDGLEICRQIKREPSTADLFVVIISGTYVDTAEQSEGLELGADGYITRPIANRELLARVESFVRIVQLNQSLRRMAEELRTRSEVASQASDAALNLMEDAVQARDRLQGANEDLRNEIAERERAETELRASEERYRLLFENNPLSMWLYDVETLRFLAVNESAIQHYGYSRDEFLGMTIKQIRPEEDIAMLLKAVAREEAIGRTSGEYRHRRKDGTIIHVEVISSPLLFAGRRARLVLAADITEKKLLEQKFLHVQRIESLGMLAAGIAHDLNNVLAPIMFAAPLLRGSLLTPRDIKILNTLEHSAARGAGLVKQILGFVHSATGDFQPTQIMHLVRDVIGVIEETFPKMIELQSKIPSALWPVLGNPTQIHQVLMNLCVNARDAMPKGGTLSILMANQWLDAAQAAALPGARPGAWLTLEISDTGTGIPSDTLNHIWEPFFTTKDVGKGTGLGLSTVRGIVASHQGFITLHTEVGRGSTFRVFLPAIAAEAIRPSSAPPFPSPDGGNELVLVVDDDANIREIVATILSQRGYRVESGADGVEAINLFAHRRNEVAIVVTDVDMPRMSGLVLTQTLLQLRPDLRIVAMSGLSRGASDAADVAEIRKLVHAFLRKPFTAEDLLATVHRLLHPTEKL